MCSIVARPGWVPEEASSAQPFKVLLHRPQEKPMSQSLRTLQPVCVKRGPYEASEGAYHSRAREKLAVKN